MVINILLMVLLKTQYLYIEVALILSINQIVLILDALRLSSTSNGTHGGGSEYTTGVTTTRTAGSSGAKTVIVVPQDAPTLYYYCTNHSGMGGTANISGVSNISFTSGIDSTYKEYVFIFYDIHTSATNVSFQLNFRDGGSNYNVTKTTTFLEHIIMKMIGTTLSYNTSEDLAQSLHFNLFVKIKEITMMIVLQVICKII